MEIKWRINKVVITNRVLLCACIIG
jgi:hypothetical protein